MNSLIFDNAPLLHALLFAARPSVDEAPVVVDAEGQLKLVIDGTHKTRPGLRRLILTYAI